MVSPPLDRVTNTPEAELASVIGFGDDGELIYEEQGENNRNTT